MQTFNVGDVIIAKNKQPLAGNSKAPDLELGKEYEVKEIILDAAGNPHLEYK